MLPKRFPEIQFEPLGHLSRWQRTINSYRNGQITNPITHLPKNQCTQNISNIYNLNSLDNPNVWTTHETKASPHSGVIGHYISFPPSENDWTKKSINHQLTTNLSNTSITELWLRYPKRDCFLLKVYIWHDVPIFWG